MNPDTGRIHNVDMQIKELIGRVAERPDESDESYRQRAQQDWERRADGEPAPGSPLPPNWKLLDKGVELKPMRRLRFIVDSVDVVAQRIIVRVETRK